MSAGPSPWKRRGGSRRLPFTADYAGGKVSSVPWQRVFRTSEVRKAREPRGSRRRPHQTAVAPTASQASVTATPAGTKYSTRPSSHRPSSAAPAPGSTTPQTQGP